MDRTKPRQKFMTNPEHKLQENERETENSIYHPQSFMAYDMMKKLNWHANMRSLF